MPAATLLLREPATISLTSLVEKSQHKKPPLPEYELRLNSSQLDFISIPEPESRIKIASTDEGFESDIDTLSIVSSDDSFTSSNSQENGAKIQETDSANGSASSDSDTETPLPPSTSSQPEPTQQPSPPTPGNESYHLVDCMCYTDIKSPNVLVFVVKGDALVFRFDHLESLKNFYTNFSTFKAIANQKAYNKNYGTKFNLLQRTDRNGITHIEITKEPETRLPSLPATQKCETSNIISLNTPETNVYYRNSSPADMKSTAINGPNKESRFNSKDANSRQRSESPLYNESQSKKECNTKNSHNSKAATTQKCASTENILNSAHEASQPEKPLKKVWNSAEDLLDSPKRPERRRKVKPRAPPPPETQNILRGSYVRVNVSSSDIKHSENLAKSKEPSRLQNFAQKVLSVPKEPKEPREHHSNPKPRELPFRQFRYVEPKRNETAQNRLNAEQHSWTYSVPRFLRKPRSQSETRNFTPMAYRYIDTTQNMNFYYPDKNETSSNVSNRLFGMSSKLKDFSTVNSNTISRRYENWENRNDIRRSSLGELSYKINNPGGSLKSVIKKDDNKRRNNEKKVTFSAYTTVQVV